MANYDKDMAEERMIIKDAKTLIVIKTPWRKGTRIKSSGPVTNKNNERIYSILVHKFIYAINFIFSIPWKNHAGNKENITTWKKEQICNNQYSFKLGTKINNSNIKITQTNTKTNDTEMSELYSLPKAFSSLLTLEISLTADIE